MIQKAGFEQLIPVALFIIIMIGRLIAGRVEEQPTGRAPQPAPRPKPPSTDKDVPPAPVGKPATASKRPAQAGRTKLESYGTSRKSATKPGPRPVLMELTKVLEAIPPEPPRLAPTGAESPLPKPAQPAAHDAYSLRTASGAGRLPVFDDHPVVNGLIYSEVLGPPKGMREE